MLYKGEFKNIDEQNITVEILTQNDKSQTTELLLAADPITITAVSNGLFSPIKTTSCTIRILTELIYPDMYTSLNTYPVVTVTNNTLRRVLFRGYVTPNIYNQEYVGLDSLEIEAICAVSALKNIKYDDDVKNLTIVNWYSIIKDSLLKVGYKKFYISDTYRLKANDDTLLLPNIYQFQGNFHDNDDERTPWKYYDILEEFCKYFCMSLVVWNDEVYFMDYNYMNDYVSYNLIDDTSNKTTISHNYSINADSYKETGATISYDETFNKVEVKDNLYDLDIETNAIDDEDLVNQNTDPNKYYSFEKEVDEGGNKVNKTYMVGFFNNTKWSNFNPSTTPEITEIIPDPTDPNYNADKIINMSFWQKVTEYNTEEEPANLNWKTYLTAYNNGGEPQNDGTPISHRYQYDITSPFEWRDFLAKGGYFILNIDYKFSENLMANECLKSSDVKYIEDGEAERIKPTRFPVLLSIGNYYYNGDSWLNYDDYNRKVQKGYFRQVFEGSPTGGSSNRTWYKYKDKDGDWAFCLTEEEYWALPDGTIKEKGENPDGPKYYWYEGTKPGETAKWVWIDNDYYNECLLGDCFFAIHTNKKGDKIFDDIKKMDNSASWKMNIKDSEEGIAIKLPDFLLSGKLKFAVKTPEKLGTYGQWKVPVSESPVIKSVHIEKLRLDYKTSGDIVNIYNNEINEKDVMYTNVIDDNYVNEWDGMELKINSLLDNRVTSASSVLKTENDSNYYDFLTSIYSNASKQSQLQENNIIDNYYKHYVSPKVILNVSLNNVISPYTKVYESNLDKTLVLDSYEMSIENNQINAKLIEL